MSRNRVRQIATVVGTGDVQLGAVLIGHRAIGDIFTNGQIVRAYVIECVDGSWEIGKGTYDANDNTLERTTVLDSSNNGSLVVFSSEEKTIFIDLPDQMVVTKPDPVDRDAVFVLDENEESRSTQVYVHEDANDKLQTNATFMAWSVATDGTVVTYDLDESDKHTVTYGGNRTLVVDNVSVGQRISLLRNQDSTGNRVETWFSNIHWDNNLAPVPDPRPNGWDLVVLDCIGLDSYSTPIWVEVSRTSSAPRKGITVVDYDEPFDLRVSPVQEMTLEGNPTIELVSGSFYKGLVFSLGFIQDGTGNREVTFGSSFGTINWTATNGVQPLLPNAGGSVTRFCFICTGSNSFDCLGVTGVAAQAITVSHLVGGTSAPTISAGTGAGTGGSASVTNADDLSGIIQVITGTSPAGSATICTLTFAETYSVAPNVVLFPANSATALLSGNTMIYAETTTTTLLLKSNTSGLTGSTTYKWFYQLTE